MKKWITQKEEMCSKCGDELPIGSYVYLDDEDIECKMICQDCLKEDEGYNG